MNKPPELSERPQSRREWHGVWRSLVLPLVVVGAIVGVIFYVQGRKNDAASTSPADGTYYSLESQGIQLGATSGAGPKRGETAPDFTLVDLDGKLVRLSDLRGKTIIINFWATWCVPCRQEFPRLVDMYERNKDRGLVVIGVDIQESPQVVRKFADTWAAKYPIVIDVKGSVASEYRISGLPVTWFVDAEGVARAQVIGLLTEELLQSGLKDAGFSP